MKTDTNKALEALNDMIEGADKALAHFAKGFAQDPIYAMGSADRAFRAAATKKVAERQRALVAVHPVPEVVAELEKDLMRTARIRDDKSTSPSANELARCELQAMAEVLDALRYAVQS